MIEYRGQFPRYGVLRKGFLRTTNFGEIIPQWNSFFRYDKDEVPGGVTTGVVDLPEGLATEMEAYQKSVEMGFIPEQIPT